MFDSLIAFLDSSLGGARFLRIGLPFVTVQVRSKQASPSVLDDDGEALPQFLTST
jgi:hypothetical protein